MKQLYKRLPTFAPDYSGAHNVGFDMGGILVLHEPGGCQAHPAMMDEPRAMGPGKPPCFSTALREVDTVVGSDDSVVTKVVNAVKTMDAKLVVTMSTPVSMLVGTDMNALGRLIERKAGVPVLAVQTNGLSFYDEGQSKAYLALLRKFVPAASAGKQKLVNVIGATPLDMWDLSSLQDLEEILKGLGFEKVNVWGYGGVEEVARSADALVNIAASVSALETVRQMEKKYGIPYVVADLFGAGSTDAFRKAVCEAAGLPAPEESAPARPENALPGVKKALVIGEQVGACALRHCLRDTYGLETVDVVSFFRMDKALMEGCDAHIGEEEELQAFIDANGPYDIVFGDSMFQRILNPVPELYVSMPHTAVSSILGCFNASNTVGAKGNEYLDAVWEEIREQKGFARQEESLAGQATDDMFMGQA